MSFRYKRRRRFRRTRRTVGRRTFGRPLARRQKGFVQTAGYFGRFRSTANPLAFQRNSSKELKFKDTTQDLTDIPNTAVTTLQDSINKILQNTSETGRIGRNIVIKKIMFKGELNLKKQSGATGIDTSHDNVRLIVYLDKQANGAIANTADILETVGGGSQNSFRNLANSKRFVILMDKKWQLHANTSEGVGATYNSALVTRNVEYFINVNLPIEFDSVAGAITEIQSNNIGILAISEVGKCNIAGTYRIRFYG